MSEDVPVGSHSLIDIHPSNRSQNSLVGRPLIRLHAELHVRSMLPIVFPKDLFVLLVLVCLWHMATMVSESLKKSSEKLCEPLYSFCLEQCIFLAIIINRNFNFFLKALLTLCFINHIRQ